MLRSLTRAARTGALPPFLAFTACDSPVEPAPVMSPAAVASIEVGPQPKPIRVGGSVQFSATPRDAAGRVLDLSVSWMTEDTALATISASGLFAARGAGVAHIVATSGARTVAVSVDIRNGTPVVERLQPASIEIAGDPFTLSVHGNGFASGAVVYWNGQPRPTTVLSATQVTIEVGRLDLYQEGVRAIHVVNPDGNADQISGVLPFTISPAQPVRTEYRLVGLETRRWPTTKMEDTTWADEQGRVHHAVLYVTGGTLTITHQAGRDTRWELRLNTETHVEDRFDPVRRTSVIDGGAVLFDLFTGQMMLQPVFNPSTWHTRIIGPELDAFVMLHRIGGTELPWLFERVR